MSEITGSRLPATARLKQFSIWTLTQQKSKQVSFLSVTSPVFSKACSKLHQVVFNWISSHKVSVPRSTWTKVTSHIQQVLLLHLTMTLELMWSVWRFSVFLCHDNLITAGFLTAHWKCVVKNNTALQYQPERSLHPYRVIHNIHRSDLLRSLAIYPFCYTQRSLSADWERR